MKQNSLFSSFILVFCITFMHAFEFDSVGRVVQSQLGTLYNLRDKISAPSQSSNKKNFRGYSHHFSPSDVSSTYLQSRMGKNSDTIADSDKASKWAKYAKMTKKDALNSFNVHVKNIESSIINETEVSTTTLSPIQTLGQGLNQAMTNILTQKLMSIIDADAPASLFTPLKHLVASGNKMVEFWDKKAVARDGKNPGIVEMLGYGLEQLKKFRDGQAIKETDPVANLTSPSKTLIQGMITVKKLTNRVLGYDTTNEVAQSRGGGYGHESYGHGGYGQYMSYGGSNGLGGLDPFTLLAALAFGAFLLQLLLTLINSSARSLNVVDLNTPLLLSDFHLPNFVTNSDKLFGTQTVRQKRDASDNEEGGLFYSIVDKLDGAYKTYKDIKKNPKCAKLHLCKLAVYDAISGEKSLLTPLYEYGMETLANDKSASEFVESIKERMDNGEDIKCEKLFENCANKDKRKSG